MDIATKVEEGEVKWKSVSYRSAVRMTASLGVNSKKGLNQKNLVFSLGFFQAQKPVV